MDHKPKTISDLAGIIKAGITRIGGWKLKITIPIVIFLVAIFLILVNWQNLSHTYQSWVDRSSENKFQNHLQQARDICTKKTGVSVSTFDKLGTCNDINGYSMESGKTVTEDFLTPYGRYFSEKIFGSTIPTNITQVDWNVVYKGCLGDPPPEPGPEIPECKIGDISGCDFGDYVMEKLARDNRLARQGAYNQLTDEEREGLKDYIQCMWNEVPELEQ